MRKLAMLIASIIFALSLAACGVSQTPVQGDTPAAGNSNGTVDIKDSYDKATAYVESVFDVSDMTFQSDEDSEGSISSQWIHFEDRKKANLSDELDINGNKIILGQTKEKDLEGFDMEVSTYADTIAPNETMSIMLKKDGKNFNVSLQGDVNGDTIPVEDATVMGFQSAMFYEDSIPFDYSGLKFSSTIEDAIKIFGEPNYSIRISTDEFASSIELGYINDTNINGAQQTDTMHITFIYDETKDSAFLSNIFYSRDIFPLIGNE